MIEKEECAGSVAPRRGLAAHPQLRFRQQQIVAIEREHFAGTQSVAQHQADDGPIPRGVEAGPEARHLVYR
jgi:hypothetical protein